MNEIIKKNGVNYGILIGILSIITTTTVYAIDLKLFTSGWIGGITILLNIVIAIFLVLKTKKQLNNLITFKEAFSVYFIAGVIGYTLGQLFQYVLFNFIDTKAKETLKEITIKYTTEVMAKFGTPNNVINETIAEMEKADSYSIGNVLVGIAMAYIFIAIFGLILAAIFKSKTREEY